MSQQEADARARALDALAELDGHWAATPAAPRLRALFAQRSDDYGRLVKRIERATGTPLPVLVDGAPGSEIQALVALTIHQTGAQRSGPFVRARGLLPPLEWTSAFAAARGGSLLISDAHTLPSERQRGLLEHLDGTDPRVLVTTSGPLCPELAKRLAVLRIVAGDRTRDATTRAEPKTDEALDAMERRAIATRLEAFDWQQQRTADSLGIDRKTLYRKIKRYGLEQPDGSSD